MIKRTGPLQRWRALPRKLFDHARLLHRDPERFGRNLLQVTNPALYEARLLDLLSPPPMHIVLNDAGAPTPRLNVLDAAWGRLSMTGGPNTAVNLALRIAERGVAVRLVATASIPTIDPSWFRAHAASLLGADPPDIPVVTAADPRDPLSLHAGDLFLATHWTTAQQLKPVLPRMPTPRFFYMLQEFEAGFYPWSSNHALALETLGMDFVPIINERLLAEHLLALPYGRMASPETRRDALVFDPAVDRALFYPAPRDAVRPRRLLFYARPTNTRNMFGLGIAALREVAHDASFAGWEFLSIGSRDGVPDLALGNGMVLRRAPWVDYAGYANLLRSADVLFCPMLSPHTSYPVLEMVACGGWAVTNSFLTKTVAALEQLSSGIIAVEPTREGLVAGLRGAALRVASDATHDGLHGLPRSWAEALAPTADAVAMLCSQLGLPSNAN